MNQLGGDEHGVNKGNRNNNNNHYNSIDKNINTKNNSNIKNNSNGSDSNPIKNLLTRSIFNKNPARITTFSPAIAPGMISYSSNAFQKKGENQINFDHYKSNSNRINSFQFLDDELNDLANGYSENKKWYSKTEQQHNRLKEGNGEYDQSFSSDFLLKDGLQNYTSGKKRSNQNKVDNKFNSGYHLFDSQKGNYKKEDVLQFNLAEKRHPKKAKEDTLASKENDLKNTIQNKSPFDSSSYFNHPDNTTNNNSNIEIESAKRPKSVSKHRIIDKLIEKQNKLDVMGSSFNLLQKLNENYMNRFNSQVNKTLSQYYSKNVDVTINIGKIEIKSNRNSSSQHNGVTSINNGHSTGSATGKTRNLSPFLKPKISLSDYIRLRTEGKN